MHASMMSENTEGNLENQVCAISASANRCLFKQYLESCHINNQFAGKELTARRKQTVIVKSIDRGNSLQVDINKLTSLAYHSNCYLDYTSNEKIERYLKRKNNSESAETTPRKLLRASIEAFEFKTQCFICGKSCAVKADPKHPDRFKKNPGVLCRTADRGSAKFEDGKEVKRKSFKQATIDQMSWQKSGQGL